MQIQHAHTVQETEIMTLLLQEIYVQLGFSLKATRILFHKQILYILDQLSILSDKNVDDICNVMVKPDGKNAVRTPDRRPQVLVITPKHLKLASFLFHHRWRCTYNWEVMEVQKETVCKVASWKKLKDK